MIGGGDPLHVTSRIWGPPPPSKEALSLYSQQSIVTYILMRWGTGGGGVITSFEYWIRKGDHLLFTRSAGGGGLTEILIFPTYFSLPRPHLV